LTEDSKSAFGYNGRRSTQNAFYTITITWPNNQMQLIHNVINFAFNTRAFGLWHRFLPSYNGHTLSQEVECGLKPMVAA